MTEQEAFDELTFYTLSHGDSEFIHQYVVDAFTAQTVDETSKPIKVAFALAGLYLHLEKGYTGKEVQVAHGVLAPGKHRLPRFTLPDERGAVTVCDVLREPPCAERDSAVERWMVSVWEAWSECRPAVADWLNRELGD